MQLWINVIGYHHDMHITFWYQRRIRNAPDSLLFRLIRRYASASKMLRYLLYPVLFSLRVPRLKQNFCESILSITRLIRRYASALKRPKTLTRGQLCSGTCCTLCFSHFTWLVSTGFTIDR